MAPGYEAARVREKFGSLDVRLRCPGPVPEEAWALVAEVAERSLSVCEACGAPERLRAERPWRKTYCDPCAASGAPT